MGRRNHQPRDQLPERMRERLKERERERQRGRERKREREKERKRDREKERKRHRDTVDRVTAPLHWYHPCAHSPAASAGCFVAVAPFPLPDFFCGPSGSIETPRLSVHAAALRPGSSRGAQRVLTSCPEAVFSCTRYSSFPSAAVPGIM